MTRLIWGQRKLAPQDAAAIYQEQFFYGQSAFSLFMTPICGMLLFAQGYLTLRIKFGTPTANEERHGRRTKGGTDLSSERMGGDRSDGHPAQIWSTYVLNPLQKRYLGTYLSCSMLEGSARMVSFRSLLLTAPKRKTNLVHDADVDELSPAPDPCCPWHRRPLHGPRGGGFSMRRWDLYRPTDLKPGSDRSGAAE